MRILGRYRRGYCCRFRQSVRVASLDLGSLTMGMWLWRFLLLSSWSVGGSSIGRIERTRDIISILLLLSIQHLLVPAILISRHSMMSLSQRTHRGLSLFPRALGAWRRVSALWVYAPSLYSSSENMGYPCAQQHMVLPCPCPPHASYVGIAVGKKGISITVYIAKQPTR